MNYPIVMGSDKLSEEYGGVDALPTTFVLDTNGRVVQKHMGVYPEEVYDREIRALLGTSPARGDIRRYGADFPEECGARDVASRRGLFGADPGLEEARAKRLNTKSS